MNDTVPRPDQRGESDGSLGPLGRIPFSEAVPPLGKARVLRSDQRSVIDLAAELKVSTSQVGVDFARREVTSSPAIAADDRRLAEIVADAIHELPAADSGRLKVDDLLGRLDDGSDAFTVLRQTVETSAAVSADQIAVQEIVDDFRVGEATYLRIDEAISSSPRPSQIGWRIPIEMMEGGARSR